MKNTILSLVIMMSFMTGISFAGYQYVKPYVKADGTIVGGYLRSTDNDFNFDNLSYKPSQAPLNQSYYNNAAYMYYSTIYPQYTLNYIDEDGNVVDTRDEDVLEDTDPSTGDISNYTNDPCPSYINNEQTVINAEYASEESLARSQAQIQIDSIKSSLAGNGFGRSSTLTDQVNSINTQLSNTIAGVENEKQFALKNIYCPY